MAAQNQGLFLKVRYVNKRSKASRNQGSGDVLCRFVLVGLGFF